jgi:flagellar protein FliJ
MARRFPLEGLLRVRTIWEDRAAAELADARRQEQRARDRAARTAELLGDSAAPVGSGSASFMGSVLARAALSSMLADALTDVAAAEESTAGRAAAWSTARQATRSVERLAERHADAERRAEDRVEQQAIDEIAGRSTRVVLP